MAERKRAPKQAAAKEAAKPARKPRTSTAATPKKSAAAPVPAGRSLGSAPVVRRVLARVHAYPPRHNAGAEWMLHSLLRALAERGHAVTVSLSRYTPDREPYTLDGVRVVPLAAESDLAGAIRKADVVVSHLENVPSAGALARGFATPLVVISHNTFTRSLREAAGAALVVYNSEWMRGEVGAFYEEHPPAPAATLTVSPAVRAADYATDPGECVTLVNLAEAKGASVFWELARRMPKTKFLAVRGAYGEQVVPQKPPSNVEIVDHVAGHRMRDEVYARTRVLLMPSAYESWGRVGAEALASGIPVVSHPNPGTVEMLGGAAILAERTDVDAWQATLERLADEEEYAAASKRAKQRSAELDPHADLVAWCKAVEAL